jgi:hypothetical protein
VDFGRKREWKMGENFNTGPGMIWNGEVE